MSNITANKFNNIREGQFGSAPALAATKYFIGGGICIDSDGRARKAGDTAGFVTGGICSGGTGPAGSADNSAGANDAIDITFRKGCDVWLEATGFTPAATDYNVKVYWSDDQTVAKAGTTTNDILAGRIVGFDGTKVLVRLATPGEMDDLAGIAELTEASGAIGGTNDGDLPAFIANLTENAGAIGGTNDGDLPTQTATVGSDIAAFTDPPSAAEMALLRTFVNALKADNVALRAGVRECAAKINTINTATTAQIRELADKVNEIINA